MAMSMAATDLGVKKKLKDKVGGADTIEVKPPLDAMVQEYHDGDAMKKKQAAEDALRRKKLDGSAASALGLRT